VGSLVAQVKFWMQSTLRYYKFPSSYGCYRGIYDTAEAAIADAPKGGKIGYDHPDLAQEYRDDVYRQEQPGEFNPKIGFFDYPMVMWLRQLLKPGMRVFDFGGNIGTQYYNYRDYIDYPIDLSWLICEVPEIRQQGEDLARERHSSQLSFTSDFYEANGRDLFFASGSIQHLPSFIEMLTELGEPPQQVLIGRLPLCEGDPFFTLQNGGLVFYPIYVNNRQELIQSLTHLGYELIDLWQDRSEPCSVPFHSEMNQMSFWGLYLRKKSG
jgi:putative methyltransferase (TIGR04325 family)